MLDKFVKDYVKTEKILAKYPNMPLSMLISVDEAVKKIIDTTIDE